MNSASLTALRDAFQHCRDMNASLKERLDSYSLAVRQIIPPYADAVENSHPSPDGQWCGVGCAPYR